MDAVTRFNATLRQLFADLSSAFPGNEDFRLAKSALQLAVSFTPEKPQQVFHKYVALVYADQISARDEGFFLQHDFDHLVTETADFDIVHRIRTVWGDMSDDNRGTVWKYLQALLALDRKCVL